MTIFTITADELAAHRPDVLLPPDEEFVEDYAHAVRVGRELAAERTVALVAICRNAMPWLPQTLRLVEETGAMFKSWRAFIFENDSADQTKSVLAAWADNTQRNVSLNFNHRPHLSHTIATERTIALAEYREQCQWWVRNGEPCDYVIVFDTDAWGGWSVDGVATSVAHMEDDESWCGLASYSWGEMETASGRMAIHYDAFAARQNHWRRRDQQWFHHWHPAVGSYPIEFNSAFGQLAVYDYNAYLTGTYTGDDCEHCMLHRSIADANPHRRFGLNPSARCVSFWVPNGGLHGNH
jgi:hypothetical protein